MLLYWTSVTVYLGMVISLWLAAYLLARGLPSRVTVRAAIVMALMAAYFYSAYTNAIVPAPNSTEVRALLVVWALVFWFDLTDKLIPPHARGRHRLVVAGIYALGVLASVILIARRDAVIAVNVNPLWSTHTALGPAFAALAAYYGLVMAATFYNFYVIGRAGGAPHQRFFLIATILGALTTAGYYVLLLPGMPAVPTAAQGALLLVAVIVFGYAVARHQAFIERRTALHDFPVSGIAVVGLAGLYTLLGEQHGFSRDEVADVAVLAVLTHAGIDLVREFLDRLLHQGDSDLRQRLRQLARNLGGEESLPNIMHQGLTILVHRLNAQGAFVALKRDGRYVVAATINSRPIGTVIEAADGDDIAPPGPGLAGEVDWLAPAFAGTEQLGVIGLRPARSARSRYSEVELDVLGEVADWVGLLATTRREQREAHARLANLAAEAQSREVGLQAGTEDLLATIEHDPAPEFVQLVEESMRHLADYTVLGQSPLAERLQAPGVTHIERGKAVRQRLIQALETLRPSGQRPAEPLPREWQGYIVLHDAYLDDVPNREIMARLYISQGTFNRLRRRALRAVARNLLEINQAVLVPALGQAAAA